MTPGSPLPPPRPDLENDPAQYRKKFAQALAELKTGTTLTLQALAKKHPDLKSKSTIGYYLNGAHFPAWVWVNTFVAVCLSRYQLDPHQLKRELEIWKVAWRQARDQQDDPTTSTELSKSEQPSQGNARSDEDSPASAADLQTTQPQKKKKARILRRLGLIVIILIPIVMLGPIGARILEFLGDVTLSVSATRKNQPPTEPPTAQPLEATVNLSHGWSFDLDNSKGFSDANAAEADFVVNSSNLRAVGTGPYLAALPNSVEPKRSSCENVDTVTTWTKIIESEQLTAGAHICVFTNETARNAHHRRNRNLDDSVPLLPVG